MRKIYSCLVILAISLLNSPYAKAQEVPLELRPLLSSMEHCDIDRGGQRVCFRYFADELELVVGDSILKPLPRRADELEAVRSLVGKGKAAAYEFFSDRLSKELRLDSEMTQKIEEIGFNHVVRIRFKNVNSDQEFFDLISLVAQDGNVKSIYLTSQVKALGHTDDPLSSNQWYLAKEKFHEAQEMAGFGSPDIHTTFFDSGYDVSHPDLPRPFGYFNHMNGVREIPPDLLGHGTTTAGVVLMKPNNEVGGVGVSPKVSFWVRKVMNDDGIGDWTTIAIAIVDQTAECVKLRRNNPDIRCTFNFSLGGIGPIPSLDSALDLAYSEGIVAVAAAGNIGVSLDRFLIYPAAKPGTIAAAALDERDNLPYWSAYGVNSLVVAAGGVNILSSTIRSGEFGHPSRYRTFTGTSYSAPQVVGAINLAWSKHRNITPKQMKFLVLGANDPVEHLKNLIASGGRLNALIMVDIDLDQVPLPPKLFAISNVSHVSITTTQSFKEPVVGYIVFVSEEPFDEQSLNRKNVESFLRFEPGLQVNVGKTSEMRVGYRKENTTFFVRMHAISRIGNVSPLSETIEAVTKKSDIFITRTFNTPDGGPDPNGWYTDYGPLSISEWENKVPHLSSLLPSPTGETRWLWRIGRRNQLDYWTGSADMLIVSEIFDLRGLNGASLLFDYFQVVTPVLKFADQLQLYAIELDEHNVWYKSILLKNYVSHPNSRKFATSEEFIDLSPAAGKKFRLVFRVTYGTGGIFGGIGWMFGNIRIFTDQREYLY